MSIMDEIRQQRTTEAKVMEAIAVVLLLIMWILILRICVTSTGTIATHFDATGQPDEYSSVGFMAFEGVMATLGVVLCLVSAYAPQHLINMPVKLDTPRKLHLVRRMVRILAIEIAAMFIAFTVVQDGESWVQGVSIASSVLVLATILIFCIIIPRAK